MKRRFLLIVAIVAMLGFVLDPGLARAGGVEIGAKLDNFTLKGTDGKEYSLDGLKGKNGAVIIFLSAQCPIVKAYVDRINTIAAEYNEKGITFIGINSNSTESLEWVTSDAAERYKFPMLIDTGNVLADKLGATVTPEVYFTDPDNVLLYHGAIDNDKAGENITSTYLKTAFDAALSGKAIEMTQSKAFGCSIKRAKAE